jgi:DNA recombination protein RmuC
MQAILIILLVILIAAVGAVLFYLAQVRKAQEKPEEESQALKVMVEWMKEIKVSTDQNRVEIQKNIDKTNVNINERLDKAAQALMSVNKELGQVQQIGKSLSYVQDFLLSAKKRGTIGEQIMEEMLRQSLPPHMYALQYRFRSGEIVDSIVKVGDRILAMDSKFTMENYRAYINSETDELRDAARKLFTKDIKKRIDEIAKKYIVQAEKTFDFALMYVPADGVFNEISDDVEIYEYARSKHVHIVSPSTFYYFLQVLLIGLQRERVNEQAEHILQVIMGLRQDSEKLSGNLGVLAKHITNAKQTMELVGSQYDRIHGKIDEVAQLRIEKQPHTPEAIVPPVPPTISE